MTMNYVEIEKVISELDLNSAYLQKVKPVNYDTFIFSFYKKSLSTDLLISTATNCRVHKNSIKQKKLGKPHNLVEFIKAYLIGANVQSVEQLNDNRIIKIVLIKNSISFNMYIRLWGGFSNIIITNDSDIILHLHKKNSKKNELAGQVYKLPTLKKQEKEYILPNYKNFPNFNAYIENKFNNFIQTEQVNKENKQIEAFRLKRKWELEKLLKNLYIKKSNYELSEKYKLIGDLITSNIHQIKTGDTELETLDYTTGEKLNIKLQSDINPVKNSELYYKKYKKAISGLNITNAQIVESKKELDNLETLMPQIKSETININNNIITGLRYKSGEWELIVGRSAKENEELLRKHVKGNDMWFHIRDFPGSYVFIKHRKNKSFPLETLIDAGTLALFYSKAKSNEKGDVQYTQVKNLRKIKKGKPGQVIVSNDKNLYITLDKNRLNRLKA